MHNIIMQLQGSVVVVNDFIQHHLQFGNGRCPLSFTTIILVMCSVKIVYYVRIK
jgi:hypothetical protein